LEVIRLRLRGLVITVVGAVLDCASASSASTSRVSSSTSSMRVRAGLGLVITAAGLVLPAGLGFVGWVSSWSSGDIPVESVPPIFSRGILRALLSETGFAQGIPRVLSPSAELAWCRLERRRPDSSDISTSSGSVSRVLLPDLEVASSRRFDRDVVLSFAVVVFGRERVFVVPPPRSCMLGLLGSLKALESSGGELYCL